MADDIALEIQGIPGESKITGHEDWIDLLSWGWGMSQTGTFHTGHGGGAGKVNVQDLTIEKFVDASSPALMRHCCDGTHIPKMTLHVRKAAGKSPLDYVVIDFEKIMVASVTPAGVSQGEGIRESVSFNFAKYKIKYTRQTDDGSAGKQHEQGWDMEKNEAV